MRTLICGSIAYDNIMVFPDHFKNHILPEKIHALHVAYLVPECLLIEPAETESKETLDAFVVSMKEILQEIESQPDMVKGAPHTMSVRKLDDVKAARELDLAWKPNA